ncbi:unnamed protein product [Soboliphyme baturini]|uniref:cDNA n=1 Tax=Soboliphyme baturini TaxID=241478 RepID=A0A183IA58_9BILA|nr:unnamed protein product [Soboliphyme baturini]
MPGRRVGGHPRSCPFPRPPRSPPEGTETGSCCYRDRGTPSGTHAPGPMARQCFGQQPRFSRAGPSSLWVGAPGASVRKAPCCLPVRRRAQDGDALLGAYIPGGALSLEAFPTPNPGGGGEGSWEGRER